VFGSAWLLATALVLQSVPSTQTPERAAPQPVVQDRPIRDLFRNLVKDIRALPSRDSAWLATAGTAGGLIAGTQDERLSAWVTEQGPSNGYTSVGDVLGNGWVQVGGAFATYAGGLLTHSTASIHLGSDLIRAQALNGLLTRGLKLATQRARPTGDTSDSFPSGHTSGTFASAAVLQGHYGWKVGIPAYLFGGFVGWTRVRDNQHWLSDVVVGASLGTIAGHTVTIGHRKQRWTIVPTAGSNRIAVFVTRQ
jgi:membrane-associated phospholipid phosphatase